VKQPASYKVETLQVPYAAPMLQQESREWVRVMGRGALLSALYRPIGADVVGCLVGTVGAGTVDVGVVILVGKRERQETWGEAVTILERGRGATGLLGTGGMSEGDKAGGKKKDGQVTVLWERSS